MRAAGQKALGWALELLKSADTTWDVVLPSIIAELGKAFSGDRFAAQYKKRDRKSLQQALATLLGHIIDPSLKSKAHDQLNIMFAKDFEEHGQPTNKGVLR